MKNKIDYIKEYAKDLKLSNLCKKVDELIEYGEKKDLSYQDFLFKILNVIVNENPAKMGKKIHHFG